MAVDLAKVKKIAAKFGEIKDVSGTRFKVLLKPADFKERTARAKQLAVEVAGAVSNDGKKVTVGSYTFELKPASLQGTTSSGVGNEHNLVNAINYVIQQNGKNEPITVTFTDGTHKASFKNVTSAVSAGTDTAGRKKSDVNLMTAQGHRPLSLKQDNAEFWESADTYWGKNATPFLQKLLADSKVQLTKQPNGDTFVSPNFAIEATDSEKKDVIFGSDIQVYKGSVITRTFVGEDFSWNGAKAELTIKASSVINTLADVPSSKEVYFLIRNASGRKSVPGYTGLRVMAAYKSRINQNVIVIPASQRSQY